MVQTDSSLSVTTARPAMMSSQPRQCWAELNEHHSVTIMMKWRHSSIILNLGTRWRWVVSFIPLPPYSRGNSPQYTLDRRQGGHQSSVGRCVEEQILLSLSIIKSQLLSPDRGPVPTEVSRLSWSQPSLLFLSSGVKRLKCDSDHLNSSNAFICM